MVKIKILKFYLLENGNISGMFQIEAKNVTKAVQHELVDFSGLEAEVRAVSAETGRETAIMELERKAAAFDRIAAIVDLPILPAPTLLHTDTGDNEFREEPITE